MKVAASTGALLERSEELARIESALADARAGRGTFVVVEGPAGIGKTALLAAARTAAAESGMRVLRVARRRSWSATSPSESCGSCSSRRWPRHPSSSAPICCKPLPESRPACSGFPGAPPADVALLGRRSLVRDPARPLLAVRESRRGGPALPRRRRCALGRRPVAPLPGVPAHAARRAGRRARRRDPPSRGGHRC